MKERVKVKSKRVKGWLTFLNKSTSLLPFTFLLLTFLLLLSSAHALSVTGTVSPTLIPFETGGTPTGTVVTVTTDGTADVTVNIFRVQNFADIGSANILVATLIQRGVAPNTPTLIPWNALWLIDGEMARVNGNYVFKVVATTTSVTSDPTYSIPTLLNINSVDIHAIKISPSQDANQQPVFPYRIQYQLAKDALGTVAIKNVSGQLVRTLISNMPQTGEFTQLSSTQSAPTSNLLTWNGLGDDGHPVPLAIYTVTFDAKDPASADQAITRTRTLSVQNLAGINSDPQKLFEDNVFVYPNPIRNGSGTFQFQAVRANASISLRVYTLAGDLVRDESFTDVAVGNIRTFVWDTTNQAGKKVGRGLYYYVVREEDPQGTLQTVKKLAVIQ